MSELKLMLNETYEIDGVKYRITPQFLSFYDRYTRGTSATFGNATQSCIAAYGLDPKDPKDYVYANIWATKLKKKLKILTQGFLEEKGVTYEAVTQHIASRAFKSDNPKWTEMLMEVADWSEPKQMGPAPQTNVQVNVQNNVNESDKNSFNQDFQEFLTNKYGSSSDEPAKEEVT